MNPANSCLHCFRNSPARPVLPSEAQETSLVGVLDDRFGMFERVNYSFEIAIAHFRVYAGPAPCDETIVMARQTGALELRFFFSAEIIR